GAAAALRRGHLPRRRARLAPAGLGLPPRRGALRVEVSSTPPRHRAARRPLRRRPVAAIFTPSLSESFAIPGLGLLRGLVARPAGGVQRLAAVRRHRPAGAARAPHGDPAGLPGGGDRPRAVGAGRGALARARLAGAVHDDAP